MSLSARDRQALSSIEGELGRSDPRLAALLDEFSRRTAGAAMPAVERIGRRWRRTFIRRLWRRIFIARLWRRTYTGRRPGHGQVKWLPAVLVLWLVLVCAVVAVALAAFNGNVGKACSTLAPAHCVNRSPLQR